MLIQQIFEETISKTVYCSNIIKTIFAQTSPPLSIIPLYNENKVSLNITQFYGTTTSILNEH